MGGRGDQPPFFRGRRTKKGRTIENIDTVCGPLPNHFVVFNIIMLLYDVTEKCYQCAYSPPKTVYEKVKKGYGYVSIYLIQETSGLLPRSAMHRHFTPVCVLPVTTEPGKSQS